MTDSERVGRLFDSPLGMLYMRLHGLYVQASARRMSMEHLKGLRENLAAAINAFSRDERENFRRLIGDEEFARIIAT